MSAHTPSPRVVDDMYTHDGACVRISAYDGRSDDVTEGPLITEAEANARLIAAAPELLWSLKTAVAALESHPEGDNRSDDDIARMNAALAAAEGR